MVQVPLLRPSPVDLFGEVPILEREIRLWLWSVPVWFSRHASPAKVASYVRGYDVIGKIRREKLAGTLQDRFGDETCPHCGALLEADYKARIAALEAQRLDAVHPAGRLVATIDRGQGHAQPASQIEVHGIVAGERVTLRQADHVGDGVRDMVDLKKQGVEIREGILQGGGGDQALAPGAHEDGAQLQGEEPGNGRDGALPHQGEDIDSVLALFRQGRQVERRNYAGV